MARAMVDAPGLDADTRRLALGDAAGPALARPYVERWWVFLLPLGLTVVLVALAFWLETLRDVGAGLRASGNGVATAAPSLSGAVGLSWRLVRVSVIGWTVGIVIRRSAWARCRRRSTRPSPTSRRSSTCCGGWAAAPDVIRNAFFQAMLGIMATIVIIADHAAVAPAVGGVRRSLRGQVGDIDEGGGTRSACSYRLSCLPVVLLVVTASCCR